MATIKDVARRTGGSLTTVSKYINGQKASGEGSAGAVYLDASVVCLDENGNHIMKKWRDVTEDDICRSAFCCAGAKHTSLSPGNVLS